MERLAGLRQRGAVFGLCTLSLWHAVPAAAEPLRLNDRTPDWLDLSGSERYRVEVMDNSFRAVDPGSDQMTTSKFLLHAEVRGKHWFAGAELQDSRAWWHDDRSLLGTDDVNAGEPLQAYLGYRGQDLLDAGDKWSVRAGRLTLHMGNKRIVGRNTYRNTINGFRGALIDWRRSSGAGVQAFCAAVQERQPNVTERDRLRDNDVKLDEDNFDAVFCGVEASGIAIGNEVFADAYLVSLDESDRKDFPSLNRDLMTAGIRLEDDKGPWRYELEAAFQWGDSRYTLFASDRDDLDHRAWLVHAELSRVLDRPGEPRFYLKYDYATGDEDPTDGDQDRYDPLFAARRRDFGLLGLYGPFFHSNLHSFALVAETCPVAGLKVSAAYRPAWLAEKRDIFVAGALVDRDGNSGDFLGHHGDIRLDWEVLPEQLTISGGVAYLDKGEFLRDAPNAPDNGDTVYGFSQFELKF